MSAARHNENGHNCDPSCPGYRTIAQQVRLMAENEMTARDSGPMRDLHVALADASDAELDALAKITVESNKLKPHLFTQIRSSLEGQRSEAREKREIRAALIAAQLEKSGDFHATDEERADLERRLATHQTRPPALHTLRFLRHDSETLTLEAATAFRTTDELISKAETSDTVFAREVKAGWRHVVTVIGKAALPGLAGSVSQEPQPVVSAECQPGGYYALCELVQVATELAHSNKLPFLIDPLLHYRLWAAFSLLEVWPAWLKANAPTFAARLTIKQAATLDDRPEGNAATELKRAIEDVLRAAALQSVAGTKQNTPTEPLFFLCGEGGLDAAAERLADFIDSQGPDLHATAGRYRSEQRALWTKDKDAARKLWQDVLYPYRVLAVALWPRVREKLEREGERERGIVRASTSLVTTIGQARAHGGLLVGSEVMVEPLSGLTLALPFDEGLRVAKRDGGIVSLRQLLSGRALRTYLACLVIYQDTDNGPDRDNGLFETEGPGTILDVIGARKYADPRRKSTRFHSKETRAVAEDLALFQRVRVRAVGALEAAAGDALVDELRDRRQGKRIFYAHSRLIVAELHNNYIRIPRVICTLPADDVAIGMGIATLARHFMVRYLTGRGAIEAPIVEWLEAAGIDIANQSRKEGRNFWPSAIHKLSRVAEEGKLGKLRADGQGKDTVLSLEPEPTLRKSYGPLLDAAKAQQKAKRAANVRKHLA